MAKRVYFVNRETFLRHSYEQDRPGVGDLRDFWNKRGFEEVTYSEYKAFGEQHKGPRTVVVYLNDEENTKLSALLKRLRKGNHPNATMGGLLDSIVTLYVKERLS